MSDGTRRSDTSAILDAGRRSLIARAAVLVLVVAGAGQVSAARARKPWRIGVLDHLPRSNPSSFTRRVAAAMERGGHREGRDFGFDHRWALWKYDRVPILASELVRMKPDVLLANFSEAVHAFRKETSTIPIVARVMDAVNEGFARSLERPGSNVTGFTYELAETSSKTLEFLTRISRGLSDLAILENAAQQAHSPFGRIWTAAAAKAGIRSRLYAIDSEESLRGAFESMRRGHWAAVVPWALPYVLPQKGARSQAKSRADWWEREDPGVRRIGLLAIANGVATIAEMPRYVWQGGLLLGYSAIHDRIHEIMTGMVVKILEGGRAADIPFQLPTHTYFALNARTAEALHLEIPSDLLLAADRVVR
jgi:putative tryptophan/tyrosine transport system substrate-binding protein